MSGGIRGAVIKAKGLLKQQACNTTHSWQEMSSRPDWNLQRKWEDAGFRKGAAAHPAFHLHRSAQRAYVHAWRTKTVTHPTDTHTHTHSLFYSPDLKSKTSETSAYFVKFGYVYRNSRLFLLRSITLWIKKQTKKKHSLWTVQSNLKAGKKNIDLRTCDRLVHHGGYTVFL